MRAVVRLICVGMISMLSLASAAQGRSLEITRFDATIGVQRDGSIVVSETIQLRFTGAWNGIYRDIPVDYRTAQGFNYHLQMKGIGVTDKSGRPLRFEKSRERHYQELKIFIPDANNAVRTVVVRYRVQNGLRFFEDHDELYWNITGDEWEMPIEAATATIILPEGATGLRTLAFTGAYGSRAQEADVVTEGNTVRLTMRRALAFREGLTAVIGWDKGVVTEPGAWTKVSDFLHANWILVLPLIALVVMYRLWSVRGRDPRRLPVTVQYEPPEGMTVAEVGTLIDNRPDMRDITATLVDLAVRGYVAIEEKDEPHLFGLVPGKDFSFQLLKPLAEWDKLAPHEFALLNAFFPDGQLTFVPLDSLKNRFYTHMPGIRNRIYARLMEKRFYRARPDRVIAAYVVGGILIGFGIIGGGAILKEAWGITTAATVIAGVLSGLIVMGFGLIMPARTEKGARALEGVLGFEEFLRRVEGPRFQRSDMTPDLFERYLPFAMALGVETTWAHAFEGIAQAAPNWYRGTMPGGIFHPAAFALYMGRFSQQTAGVMASAPRARGAGRLGGSGFGGGGFSGGGFGGGGGRGF